MSKSVYKYRQAVFSNVENSFYGFKREWKDSYQTKTKLVRSLREYYTTEFDGNLKGKIKYKETLNPITNRSLQKTINNWDLVKLDQDGFYPYLKEGGILEFEDNNTSRKSYTKTKIKLNDDRSHIMALTKTTTDGNHKELRGLLRLIMSMI